MRPHYFKNQDIEKLKETATEIKIPENQKITTTIYNLTQAYKKKENIKTIINGQMVYSFDAQTIDDVCRQLNKGYPFIERRNKTTIEIGNKIEFIEHRYDDISSFILINEKDFRDKCDTEEIYDAFMKEAKENPLFVQRYGQRFCKPNKQNSWDMIIRHGFYKPTVIKASFDVMDMLYHNRTMYEIERKFVKKSYSISVILDVVKVVSKHSARGKEFTKMIEKYLKQQLDEIKFIKTSGGLVL